MSASSKMVATDFPLLSSPDYFDVGTVYRMENADGAGVFLNMAARDAKVYRQFKNHLLPIVGIQLNRERFPDHPMFVQSYYYPLLKKGVWGWRSRELYDAFFISEESESICNAAGFYLVEYQPKTFIPMPDGQVLFLK